MGDSAAKPHDALFRHFVGRPSNAAARVRPVVAAALAARIDWASLCLESISFVSRHLRGTYSDLLFSARFNGRDAFVYILLEHQSSNDHFMALRMLDYLISIWNRYLRDHPESKTLPLIIPIVVHASPEGRRWTAPTEIADLVDIDPDLRAAFDPHIPRLRFLLDDLTAVTIDEIYARPNTPQTLALQVLLKTANDNKHLDNDLERLIPALKSLNADDVTTILTYIVSVADTPDERLQPIVDRIGPEAKEAFVTTADRLRNKGRDEGRVEGRIATLRETLTELLTIRFGDLPAKIANAVDSADQDQLRRWMTRFATATSLNDMRIV